ncbi:MAG: chorismate pyruvate-lyase family protein, partial [Gammaproteobacteria bacterium]
MSSVIKTNKSVPVSHPDYSALPAIVRILLTTDGTVTRILEAWFNEPMSLQSLNQELIQLDTDQPWINAVAGDQILQREVSLIGSNSGKVCINAISLVRLQELDEALINELLPGQIGIGELLHERGIGTHREILGIETDSNADLTTKSVTDVSRTYRIFVNNSPCILVTERFPLSTYQPDQT